MKLKECQTTEYCIIFDSEIIPEYLWDLLLETEVLKIEEETKTIYLKGE